MRILLCISILYFSYTNCIAGINDGDSSQVSEIEFVSFNAILSSKVIHFSWDINSESRGDHFEIEKSIDEVEWTLITTVESLKSHKERHTYKVSEINLPEAAYEYFRVVRINKDGVRTVLDVVNINQPILTDIWLLNVKGKFNKAKFVSFDSMICASGELRVLSENGTLMKVEGLHIQTGHNRYELTIKNLKPGSYTILITDEFGNTIDKKLRIASNHEKQRRKF